jgi:hypothetical protein
MRDFCRFMAGRWRSWATPEECAGIPAQYEKSDPGITAHYAGLLDRYALGDEQRARGYPHIMIPVYDRLAELGRMVREAERRAGTLPGNDAGGDRGQ